MKRSFPSMFARWLAAGAGIAAGAYAAYAAVTWRRYGIPSRPADGEEDRLLDRFMLRYDVVERHHVCVDAPAALTLAATRDMELLRLPVVRAIFKARELLLGSSPDTRSRPRGLVAEMRALGWVTLAERVDREIVMGAVTRPWEANVTFRSIAPDLFADFAEPGYVKIAWTLRADPIDDAASVFRSETRAVATDEEARQRFRQYWSFLSPGIVVIRRLLLHPLKTEAERRARASRSVHPQPSTAGNPAGNASGTGSDWSTLS